MHRKIKTLLPFHRKVGFLVCGTQKGGTSALDSYLRNHPAICMSNRKEVHYFDNESCFVNEPNYSKYHAYFSPKKHHEILGESTPIYMYWNSSPKRIWEYNPEMKLIVLLRNPIERAYSHWNMMRAKNKESLSFKDAIYAEKERCRSVSPYQHRVFSYVDRGHYLNQLKRLWSYFPKERVLILKNEDLKLKHNETLYRVTDFLEISQFKSIKVKSVNARSYEAGMNMEEKDYLKSVFEEGIKELEQELQWDCSDWLKS